ncbi:MAG: peptidoglycan DD-metalloendopeptidase family protein [Propionibacteriaceae bacterium]
MPANTHPRARMTLLLTSLLVAILGWFEPASAVAGPVVPITTGWPLEGQARVLKPFDPPDTPWGRGHRGVDLAADVGDSVLAVAGGRVTFAGRLAGRGVLVVSHGSVRSTYEPVTATVSVGTEVSAGQQIGRLSTGGHCGATSCLHWGLIRGKTYLDPLGAGAGQPLQGDGQVRLLPASARAVAERRAAARAAAERAAEAAALAAGFVSDSGLRGSSGGHGFLHPVPGGITSPFGRRFHPVLKRWKLHDGTDFGAACGTPIRAPATGRVTRKYVNGAYGHRLFLDHGSVDGRHVVTSYNHATRYVVGVGDRVRRGQVLGYVGATGYATGCHLHLMVWLNGRLTNPMQWF